MRRFARKKKFVKNDYRREMDRCLQRKVGAAVVVVVAVVAVGVIGGC